MGRTTRKSFRPTIESLADRRLMAAHLTASLAHGVLSVRGTQADDVINVHIPANRGGYVSIDGVGKFFRAAQVKRIDVLGGKGDDTINVTPSGRTRIRVRIDGGAGDDVINGVPDVPPVLAWPVQPVEPSSAASPGIPTPAGSALNATELRIIDLTNAARVASGLSPLAVDGRLSGAAAIQSTNMARLGVLDHDLPTTATPTLPDRAAAVGYAWSALGENIAFNYANADAVVAGWLASPGHRANILNGNFTQIGVGVAHDAQGEPYFTQEFGKPA